MIKKLFSHTMIYGLASQVGAIASVFSLPIITKDLSEFDYGVWGIIMAYYGGLQALAFLGMNVVISNAFFKMKSQYQWLWRQIYGFLLLWAIPYTIFLSIVLYFVLIDVAKSNTFLIIFLITFPNLLFGPTSMLGSYYYQLNQQPKPIAYRSAIFAIFTVILNIFTISYLKLGYMGWVWSFFVISIMKNLSYWYPINIILGYKPIFNFKRLTIKNSLKIGLPTIPHNYSSFLLNSSDRIVMDQLNVGIGDIGKYNIASKFGGIFRSIVLAGNRAIGPMMLEAFKEKKDLRARNLIFVFQIAILILTFEFSIWSREIFKVLVKNEILNKVYPLSIIIVMSYNYRPMYVGAINKLFYVEKTNLLWRISFIAGLTNLGLNFVFIPIFGFEAAAFTTFISLMYLGFSGHFIKKINKYSDTNYHPLFWLFIILLLTLIAYWIVEFSIFSKFIVSFVLILILFVFLIFFKDKTNYFFK